MSWCERVRLRFHRPVAGSGPWRRMRHPVAVLGVDDPHGPADLLRPHVRTDRTAPVADRAASWRSSLPTSGPAPHPLVRGRDAVTRG